MPPLISKSTIGFIIGCGRSGTNWLGATIQRACGVSVTIERPGIFQLVDQMALNPFSVPALMPKLLTLYRELRDDVAPKMYMDKSHQNIWLVEHLNAAFSDALFLGIERGCHATVASMLRHRGVLAHFKRWRNYPVPNHHIGLSKELAQHYDELPLTVKCALRWRSHHERISRLQTALDDQLLVLRYEDLVEQPVQECTRIGEFLNLRLQLPTVDLKPLNRWRRELSADEIRLIDMVLANEPCHWIFLPEDRSARIRLNEVAEGL